MQSYDLLMLLVLVATTLFGAWKGMAWQMASLASLVVSALTTVRFSPSLTPFFGRQEPWNRLLAMFAVYMATSMAIWIVFRIVAGFIDRLKLHEFDRQLGALVGLAKGGLLCVLITLVAAAYLPEDQGRQIMATRSGHTVAVLVAKADAMLPAELRQTIGPYFARAQGVLDARAPSGGA
jgi:membrane protein required for colicin V production